MKATPACHPCLVRLAHQAAELASTDPAVRRTAERAALDVLKSEFSEDRVTIVVAAEMHEAIHRATGNPEPYRAMKKRELDISRRVIAEVPLPEQSDLRSLVRLAVLGNTIDFFRAPETVAKDMARPVEFAVDDIEEVAARLSAARSVLYLADNAGEIFFDLPLVKFLERGRRLVYVVKPSPVQNDMTTEDVAASGLRTQISVLATTGTASPGVDFARASPAFQKLFEEADLVVAKGMGYYESLTELPPGRRVLYCLMAKCAPVAEHLGVPLNSYVAKFA